MVTWKSIAGLRIPLLGSLALCSTTLAHAAQPDLLRDQVVELNRKILSIVPLGRTFDKSAEADRNWPLQERATAAGDEALRCLREQLYSEQIAIRRLDDVARYAIANAAGFADDFEFLRSAGTLLSENVIESVLDGKSEPESAISAEQRAVVAALISDAKRMTLRELIGGSSAWAPFAKADPGEDTLRRLATRRVVQQAIAQCSVADWDGLVPSPKIVFEARCKNPGDIPSNHNHSVVLPKRNLEFPLPVPAYPTLSRRAAEEGTAQVRAYVTEAGSVETAVIRKSSGSALLDTQALVSMGEWHLVPGRVDGNVTCMWTAINIKFEMSN